MTVALTDGRRRIPFEGGYSTQEAVEASGCTLRQLHYWRYQGWIAPTLRGADGSGSRCRWSEVDVARMRAAAARLEWGMAVGPALFRETDPPLPTMPQHIECQHCGEQTPAVDLAPDPGHHGHGIPEMWCPKCAEGAA